MARNDRQGRRRLFIGYYGRWSFGDDLMILDLCSFLADTGGQSRVAVGGDYLAPRLRAVGAAAVRRRPWPVIRSVLWCDELVMAGGTIFHYSFTGPGQRGYVRHLWAYALLMLFSRALGKTVRLVGAGIGPFNLDSARRPARLALRLARRVHVRDAASLQEVHDLLPGRAEHAIQGTDLSLLSADRLASRGAETVPEARLGLSLLDMRLFLDEPIAARFWDGLAAALSKHLRAEPALKLTLFACWTAPDRPNDILAAEAFLAQLDPDVRDRAQMVAYDGDVERLVAEALRCRAMVTTRFHATVLAALIGRPTAIIPYNRKVTDFADEIGLEAGLRLSGTEPAEPAEAERALTRLEGLARAGPPIRGRVPEAARALCTAFELAP